MMVTFSRNVILSACLFVSISVFRQRHIFQSKPSAEDFVVYDAQSSPFIDHLNRMAFHAIIVHVVRYIVVHGNMATASSLFGARR